MFGSDVPRCTCIIKIKSLFVTILHSFRNTGLQLTRQEYKKLTLEGKPHYLGEGVHVRVVSLGDFFLLSQVDTKTTATISTDEGRSTNPHTARNSLY